MTASYSTNGAVTSPQTSQPQGQKSPENQVDTSKLKEKTKQELVSWVRSYYDKCKSAKQKIRRNWDINLLMYGGNQYVTQMTGNKNPLGMARVGTPASARHRERSVTNRIRGIIRTEITKQTSQKASVTVVPASGEDDDLFAAQAGESVWEFLHEHEHVQWKMERAAFWTSTCGNGFIKTWWDTTKKDTLFKNMMGMPTVGNISFGPVTPYNLFVPDLLEEDIENQPCIIEAYTKPVEWANKQFGGNYAATTIAKTEIYEGTYFQSTGEGGENQPDSVLIMEAWIKPGCCKLLPEGGLVTICSDQLVGLTEGMWYSHEEYPYSHIRHVLTGKFYGVSVLEDLNPLQREYNRTRSQIIESKNRMARPQLLAPIGSFDVNKYTSEPGLVIPYKPALGKPEPLQIQPIPNYVLQEVERIISDMEDISGQHQVSRGMAPGQGVVAATAIAFLQEKDDAIISTTISSIEQAISKMARQALTLAVDYWDVPRIIRVAGTDRSFDSFTLKGSDIANGLDVRVEPGSALPQSKAARQAFLMDLFTSQAISAQQMLDMMEIGGVQTLVDRMRIDMRVAQRENLRMKRLTMQTIAQYNQQMTEAAMRGDEGTIDPQRGIPTVEPGNLVSYPPMVPVNKWDNHEVHITTHNNYRKGQEFEQLAPEVKDQFEKHIQIHESYVFMKMQQQMFGMAQQGADPAQMGMTPELQTGPQAEGGESGGEMMPPGGGMPEEAMSGAPPGMPPMPPA